jgi:hypothetical protein
MIVIFKNLLPSIILCVALSCCDKQTAKTSLDIDGHAVTLTPDWSNRGQGVDIPPHYTVRTGDLHLNEISDETFTIPHIFQPGRHFIYVYNPASNITIDGTTASVEVEDGSMRSLPGWFFTSSHHIMVEEGKSYNISTTMQQQIREVTFVLHATKDFVNEVADIQASFNGVASQLDIPTGEVAGWPISVNLDFKVKSDTTFVASTRIPGIIGDTQLLTCRIVFKDNTLPEFVKLCEFHYLLEDFNADKTNPITLSVRIIPE